MSIATAISNAQAKVAAAYTALQNKGATMPSTQDLSNMPATINSIQTGGGGETLPYDAEVEYLQGDGNAYITVPFSGGSQTTTFSLDFIASNLDGNASLFGSRTSSSTRFCWVMSPTSTQTQVGYGSAYQNLSVSVAVGDLINCTMSISGSNIRYSVCNHTKGVASYMSWALSTFSVNSFVYLFWSGALNASKVRVTRLRIEDNGTKVVDCIPVRVATVGYMYDRVSGNLLGNSGTGSFTLGTDVI